MFKALNIILFTVCAVVSSQAMAVVVQNTNVVITKQGNEYGLSILQNTDDDRTGIVFSSDRISNRLTITSTLWTADAGADLYLAYSGDIFTADTIAAGQFKPLFAINQPDTYSLTIPFLRSLYIGINTGPDMAPSFPNRDVFGWVEIRNVPNNLIVVRSAMAYGESGIIIGTTTPVPEPEIYSLMIIGLGLLRLATKRKNKQD